MSTVSRAAHDEAEVGTHGRLLSYSLKPQGTDVFVRDAGQQQSVEMIQKRLILLLWSLSVSHAYIKKNVQGTCLFPAELEDLDLPEEVTAQLCGRREFHSFFTPVDSVIRLLEKICGRTHPKDSFWLRVRQVSGKQAILPRIPTQIS